MKLVRALLPLVLLAAGGCATDRPLAIACDDFARFRVAVDPPPLSAEGAPAAAAAGLAGERAAAARAVARSPLARLFSDKLRADPATATTTAATAAGRRHFLVLSGGGQWGAFGAGLISGWSGADNVHPRPERFDVVTGVSTGALQATFAFLGKQHDAGLRDAYSITDARQLVKSHGALFFLRHASMNDFAPLERYVRQKLVPLLDEVAAADKDRTLLVGVVDGLDGRMWAVDLTRIARELRGAERESCYAGALMASAAVPIVFRQVTVDGRPYLDGGVRQSVFALETQRAFDLALAANGESGTIHILMNGDIRSKEVKTLPAKLLPTVSRLRTIVFNQIEIGSIEAIAYRFPRMTSYVATAEGQDCVKADDTENEVFNPGAMKCLIDFGRDRWKSGDPWRAIGTAATGQ